MRILVISDSHRNTRVIDKILSAQPDARHVFFLGDNVGDIEDFDILYPDKAFHIVSGNCDYASMLPCVGLEIVNGIRVLYTHGHTMGVKGTIQHLLKTARENNCGIALYGHTHIANTLYDDGVWIVNPGSCSRPRDGKPSYAVIDITDKGIMPVIIEIL